MRRPALCRRLGFQSVDPRDRWEEDHPQCCDGNGYETPDDDGRDGPTPARRYPRLELAELVRRPGEERVDRVDASAHRVRGPDLNECRADDDADDVGRAEDDLRRKRDDERGGEAEDDRRKTEGHDCGEHRPARTMTDGTMTQVERRDERADRRR